jgi:uncharacterized repeat protein (TIGR03803 family)
MVKLGFWKSGCVVFLLCIGTAIVSPAQITQLYEFTGGEGFGTQAGLIQGFDGYLYGTTTAVIYKLLPGVATDTILYFFCSQPNCSDGAYPFGGLVQASDGNLYGTTTSGGSNGCGNGCGTVFALTPAGKLTTLHRFSGPDGANPYAGLFQADDGNFYGTTYGGGANGSGTIFKITSTGTLTVLYNFCGKANCADGANPRGTLLQSTNGNFYGTTSGGATGNNGTVFKMTRAATLTTLHSFGGADGSNPFAGLIQAKDGSFYGTTYAGGVFGLGTTFKVTPAGKLTTLYSFCAQGLPSCPDGANPYGGVVQSIGGSFFGTAYAGGNRGTGTIFGYSNGSVGTEYSFCNAGGCADGANPAAGLVEGTDGNLYGTTEQGGSGTNQGTVFSLWSGDNPFVETNPASGKVGTSVTILGNNLTGTTKVTFSGKAAAFTVVSDSEITTTVPTGAITGKVRVTRPGGKLLSKVAFLVSP